jgi:hypothetical protein
MRVKGIALTGVSEFAKDRFGLEAHEAVLLALAPEQRASFASPIRESAWKPVADMAAYAGALRRLYAPEQAGFYRELGRYVGRVQRERGGFQPMVADRATAIQLASKLWPALYDRGRLSLNPAGEQAGVAYIHGFPTTRALCEANVGALEGLFSSPEWRAEAEETACTLDGAPACEVQVRWTRAVP